MAKNIDNDVVEDFGSEWSKFKQDERIKDELLDIFENQYFKIFPWDMISHTSVGVDIGCGSGRWGKIMSKRVGFLHLVDASQDALEVSRKNLIGINNVSYYIASVDSLPFDDNSLDFAYSLGVLHHVPDTSSAIKSIATKLKKGAPLLLYLYYAFDNRPFWYRAIWRVSDLMRLFISPLPSKIKMPLCDLIAATVYWPLARLSFVLDKINVATRLIPLSSYRNLSFYTMRTDSLDRFGTRLEQRFKKAQIQRMLVDHGFSNIKFSETMPYWVVIGYKK